MGIAEAVYIFAVLSTASAIDVSIPQKIYEVARGDNITLPCKFKSNNPSFTAVTANWFILGGTPDDPSSDSIATYYYPGGVLDIMPNYGTRVSMSPDISSGQVNLFISSVTMSENKTFECQVQIPKDNIGKPTDKTRLIVLVAPSVPLCGIQGTPQIGQDIRLTCESKEGSPAPTYTWQSYDKNNILRPFPPRAVSKDGVLSLFNISMDATGYYICNSANKIRTASCNYTLNVSYPSMNVGSTAAIAGGILAGFLVLVILIYCCCCRRKKEPENYEMEESEKAFHDSDPKENRAEYHDDENRTDCREKINDRSEPDERPRDRRDDNDFDDRRSDYSGRKDNYDDRRSDYSGRKDNYDDRRSDYGRRKDNYDDRRSDYSGRKDDYDDRRSDYSGRKDDYNDRRSDYSGRRDDYDDRRRDDYDDRRSDYGGWRDDYNDRRDRYNDRRDDYDRRDQYNDRRNQYDDDRDRPPSVPLNKPKKMDPN